MSANAIHYLVNLLARREYSEAEIRYKMQAKAFNEEEIERAITHCQQKNWQSDRRFCESYINARSQRGYGALRIKQELTHLKGIESSLVNEVLMEMDIDWSALALAVLAKKFPDYAQIKEPKLKQKVWRYMTSHGFHSDEFNHYMG